MNVLILGGGPEERAWAASVAATAGFRVAADYPGIPGLDVPPPARDLDDALATIGLQAAVVGGPPESRAESLRRVAAEGLPAVCLHPPGPDSEAYYQVAMSRAETGAVLVPDLPARLHPGATALREAFDSGLLGAFRSLKYEAVVDPGDGDLVRAAFARAVDLVRSFLGEIEAVNATGDPPGDRPDSELVVHLRGPQPRRAEVRLTAGPAGPARLTLAGSAGSAVLELPADLAGPARLAVRPAEGPESSLDFPAWDPRAAVLDVLTAAVAGRAVHPDLIDGTRAMEVSEGVARSLRRGRTVELHYEEVSEEGTFKSVMTSLGCLVLISILGILPLALAGPALGLGGTIYIAYLIPPVLVGFILLQLFRFATRGPSRSPENF